MLGVQGMFNWADLGGEHDALLERSRRSNSRFVVCNGNRPFGRHTHAERTCRTVKGGAAWVRDEHTRTTSAGSFLSSAKLTRNGWTVGGGLEWMLAPNWSIFVEYDYMDFGNKRVAFRPGIFTADIDQRLQTVLVGVNYRFTNWR